MENNVLSQFIMGWFLKKNTLQIVSITDNACFAGICIKNKNHVRPELFYKLTYRRAYPKILAPPEKQNCHF